MNDPHRYHANAHFVAVHQTGADGNTIGPYVGMTRLTYNTVDPTRGSTHLTGVIRSYRRQGIATALKVHAITIMLKDKGYTIHCDILGGPQEPLNTNYYLALNVLLEAMAMKLPVISTTISAIPEIVEDGVNGLLVPPNDENVLTDAIIRLIQDQYLRQNENSGFLICFTQHVVCVFEK